MPWTEAGEDVAAYDRNDLMNVSYDETALAIAADEKIRTFQADAAQHAGSSTTLLHCRLTTQLHCLPTIWPKSTSVTRACWVMLLAFSARKSVRVLPVLSTRTWLAQIWVMITKNTLRAMQHLRHPVKTTP